MSTKDTYLAVFLSNKLADRAEALAGGDYIPPPSHDRQSSSIAWYRPLASISVPQTFLTA